MSVSVNIDDNTSNNVLTQLLNAMDRKVTIVENKCSNPKCQCVNCMCVDCKCTSKKDKNDCEDYDEDNKDDEDIEEDDADNKWDVLTDLVECHKKLCRAYFMLLEEHDKTE